MVHCFGIWARDAANWEVEGSSCPVKLSGCLVVADGCGDGVREGPEPPLFVLYIPDSKTHHYNPCTKTARDWMPYACLSPLCRVEQQ
jgi:hypothetical protein